MILVDDFRVCNEKISLKYVSILEEGSVVVDDGNGGGDVVRFGVVGIFDEMDSRIFMQKNVKFFGEMAANDVDFFDTGFKASDNQSLDDADTIYTH